MHAILSCNVSQVGYIVCHTHTHTDAHAHAHTHTYLNKGGTVMQTQTWTLEFLSLESMKV